MGYSFLCKCDRLDRTILVELHIFYADLPATIATRFSVERVRTVVVEEVPFTLKFID